MGHILPSENAQFDLGNAEYKIRHLFLSDNSLWIGDEHKIDISSGKMKFKKRDKTKAPKKLNNEAITIEQVKSILPTARKTEIGDDISKVKLSEWYNYADSIGIGTSIFTSNDTNMWEEDIEVGSSTWVKNSNDIYYNSGNIGIGTANPTEKLHIDGKMKFNGDIDIYNQTHARIFSERFNAAEGSFRFYAREPNYYFLFLQTHAMAFWDNGTMDGNGGNSQTNKTVYWYFRNRSTSSTITGSLSITSSGTKTTDFDSSSSDDRLKINEELIEDATKTIMKLRPQKYDKYDYLESELNNFIEDEKPVNRTTHEWGFIAQEVYYECPELRKIVGVPVGATLIDNNENMNFEDIRNDPDYSNWGNEKASLHYNSFIALLTKGFQEQQNKINTLETENQQQQTKINELTSIIDKLKTANSFEEFKNNL